MWGVACLSAACRCPSVRLIHRGGLFSFIKENICSPIQVLPNIHGENSRNDISLYLLHISAHHWSSIISSCISQGTVSVFRKNGSASRLHAACLSLNYPNLMVNACFISLNTQRCCAVVILARKWLLACWKICQIRLLNWVAKRFHFISITQTTSNKSQINQSFHCNLRQIIYTKCPVRSVKKVRSTIKSIFHDFSMLFPLWC